MRILAWCDASTAPTGFGRSSKHVLHALHNAGHAITQLAVNLDPATVQQIPWEVIGPANRSGDAYGLNELAQLVQVRDFDLLWATFDPEVPWKYVLPGSNPQQSALDALRALRVRNPGFRMLGWFPVDGGPLSNMEMAVLGAAPLFDAPVTMSPHVHDLMAWTMKLRGQVPDGAKLDMAKLAERLPVIPHGVDLEEYRIPTPDEKAAAKERLGVDPSTFLILQVERNQQRKQNYLGLEVMELLKKKHGDKATLYQHMLPNEETEGCQLGYNLPELAWRYGLVPGKDVRWPGGFVPDSYMVGTVYAAADVFLSTSTGEGFQYPAWEALACGVPLVLPNDSAREAWFGRLHAPNVYLYGTERQRQVMRGGYSRRMGYAKPEDAARTIGKMVAGHPKHKPTPERAEAGRSWVAKHADVKDVQAAWVKLVEEQCVALRAERAEHGIVMASEGLPEGTRYVSMLWNPGFGDLAMAGPGLRAIRERGTRVRLELSRAQLGLAKVLDLADEYVPAHTPQGAMLYPFEVTHLHELWQPTRRPEWTSLEQPRHITLAKQLGVDAGELRPFKAEVPKELRQAAVSRFREEYGVDLSSCVLVALQSGSPARELPDSYLRQLLPHLRALELTPVLVGARRVDERSLGVANLTGQTDIVTLAAMVSEAAAVIAVDSGVAHLAAAVGTPLVMGCTLFPAAFRLASYESTAWAAVEPPESSWPAGESFPAGVYTTAPDGAWARGITPGALAKALRQVLGAEEPAPPAVLMPGAPQ